MTKKEQLKIVHKIDQIELKKEKTNNNIIFNKLILEQENLFSKININFLIKHSIFKNTWVD